MRIAAYEHVAAATPISSMRFAGVSRPHLTYGASVRPENAVTYTQQATKVEKFVGICLKRLHSRVMP